MASESVAIEASPSRPALRGLDYGDLQNLEIASADLDGLRGLLLTIADVLDGEQESAMYGIASLALAVKERVDQTVERLLGRVQE